MRLPGRCSTCGHFRQIRVTASALIRARIMDGSIEGICADCEDVTTRVKMLVRLRERNQ
jgi:hypothetical protein